MQWRCWLIMIVCMTQQLQSSLYCFYFKKNAKCYRSFKKAWGRNAQECALLISVRDNQNLKSDLIVFMAKPRGKHFFLVSFVDWQPNFSKLCCIRYRQHSFWESWLSIDETVSEKAHFPLGLAIKTTINGRVLQTLGATNLLVHPSWYTSCKTEQSHSPFMST